MVRLIKRYESRKLYDTEESRYVSLDEVASFVRRGQEVRIVDNASDEDVTGQTLTQVILEEGRSGRAQLSTEMLHDLLRKGERAWKRGVQQVQVGVDRFVEASFDRLGPVREARNEMDRLRIRLEELESSLQDLETDGSSGAAAATKAAGARARAGRRGGTTRSKTVAKRRMKTKAQSRSKAKSKAKAKSRSKAASTKKTRTKAKAKTKATAKAKSKTKAKSRSKTKTKTKTRTRSRSKAKSKSKTKAKRKSSAKRS